MACVRITAIGMLGLLSFTIPSVRAAQEAAPASGQRTGVTMHRTMDIIASRVDAGNPDSVRAMADAVLEFPRPYPRLPDTLRGAVGDRLQRAETAYLLGTRRGVSEESLVSTFNMVVSRLGLPDYALTNLNQVRNLRMRLSLTEPQFMGRGMARQEAKIGDQINPEMSPLQAIHLFATLADQKMLNEEFQVTPVEWDSSAHSSVQTVRPAEKDTQPGPKKGSMVTARTNPKRRELDDALWRGASALGSTDGWNLLQEAMANLGVD